MNNLILQSVTVCYLCGLAGLSHAAEGESGAEKDLDLNGSDCISIRSIRDYTPLDNRTLLIKESKSRVYFVRLMAPNTDMNSGIQMAVQSHDSRLCSYGGDSLIFGNFHPRPALIRSISRITQEQEEDILVRYGKIDSDEPQTPEPREVEGAEVEELG